jgi:hypothetical protein
VRLYERAGFRRVSVVGGSWTMQLMLFSGGWFVRGSTVPSKAVAAPALRRHDSQPSELAADTTCVGPSGSGSVLPACRSAVPRPGPAKGGTKPRSWGRDGAELSGICPDGPTRPSGRQASDQDRRPSEASFVIARHAKVLTLNQRVGGSSPSRRTPLTWPFVLAGGGPVSFSLADGTEMGPGHVDSADCLRGTRRAAASAARWATSGSTLA